MFVAEPTVRPPTETEEEVVGKVSAESKLVELGLKETDPAVDNDM